MGETYPRFTVASVQAASVFFDREQNVQKAVGLIEEAADQGAGIIGFPELFISGHPEIWYLASNSNRLRTQGELFKLLVKNSLKIPGPDADRLCTAARKAHAYVTLGVSEADPLFPGTLFNSQLLISRTGDILGVHRKLVSTFLEKLIYSPGDGSHLNVFDTSYGRLSALVCGEHAHSLYKFALLAMGTQIHIAGWPAFPERIFTPAQRESVQFRVRQFAHEGKIFVLSACGVVSDQNIDFCCETQEEKDNLVNRAGGSAIIGPDGQYLAGPLYDVEGVLTAEISLEDALPGKQIHNVLGHYARWDVLSLNFNREKQSAFKNALLAGSGPPAPDLQNTGTAPDELGEQLDGRRDDDESV